MPDGFRDPICKRADKEDVRAYRADEISKEEIVAKYFSAEIDVALAKRLRQLSGVKLSAEVKKIENTMFFRLSSILNLSSSLNIGAAHELLKILMSATRAVRKSSVNLLTKVTTSIAIAYNL